MVVAGGVCDVTAATGAIYDIILTPRLWSDPKQKRRLDAEEHASEENQRKAELPGADSSSQDQLRSNHRPERLGEDQGEGVSKREIVKTGELEEQSHSRANSLQPGVDAVRPGAGQKRGSSRRREK